MTKLVATSVVRGSQQGESHGGVFLLDIRNQDLSQVIDWNTMDIDWRGRGADRGLRGIAFHDETVFIAASDELFAYDPDFKLRDSWKNPYLKHCHEISIYEGQVFLTSTGFDSILAFDIGKRKFHWALYLEREEYRFRGKTFDPMTLSKAFADNKLDSGLAEFLPIIFFVAFITYGRIVILKKSTIVTRFLFFRQEFRVRLFLQTFVAFPHFLLLVFQSV